MTTTFKLAPHSILSGVQVVEIWNGDNFVGQITPLNVGGMGIRVISKYQSEIQLIDNDPRIIEIEFKLKLR